jgi:hypothetical protein
VLLSARVKANMINNISKSMRSKKDFFAERDRVSNPTTE